MGIVTGMEIRSAPGGIYKFLRLKSPQEGREWLFLDAEPWSVPSHKAVADGMEVVVAAGLLSMDMGKDGTIEARMVDPYSSTLRIGCSGKDWEDLEVVLGVRAKSRLEE